LGEEYAPLERSIRITTARPRATIPREIKAGWSREECRAYDNPPAYFKELAKKCRFAPLSGFLKECAGCGPPDLVMFASEAESYALYFQFEFQAGPSPWVRLAQKRRSKTKLPADIEAIYEVVGAVCDNGPTYGGGLLDVNDIGSMAENWDGIWLSEENRIDPALAIVFATTLCGDLLCYLPDGQGAWYLHESGALQKVRSLRKELERYFVGLAKGERSGPHD